MSTLLTELPRNFAFLMRFNLSHTGVMTLLIMSPAEVVTWFIKGNTGFSIREFQNNYN